MDYNTIISLISSIGFPIVAYGALFWMYNTSVKELKENVAELNITLSQLTATVKSLHGDGGNG